MRYVTVRGHEKKEGVEILHWRLELPLEEDSEFYGEIERRALGFCRGELLERAERAFSEDEDPQKRFHFQPFAYRLSIKEGEAREGIVTLRLEAVLRRGREILSTGSEELFFCQIEGVFLSPRSKRVREMQKRS